MQLIDIIIDNRIPCSFIESLDVENVIFCRPLEESLDNVSIISTKDNEFIHNYIQESANNYLETNIQLSDGRVYSGVRFKLVTIEDGKELPQSTINLSSLGKHSSISERTALSNFIEEGYDFTLNSVEDVEELVDDLRVIPVSEDISEYVEKVKSYEVHLVEEQARLATQQQELQQKEEQLKRRQSVVEVNEKIQKTLEDYKSELLTEYYTAHEKQKDILNSQLSDVSTSLFKYLGEKIRDQKTSAIELLKDLSNSNLKKLQENQNIEIERLKTEINTLLSKKLETNSDNVDKLLVERSGELQQLFSEKIVLELESHKKRVEQEIESITLSLNHLIGEKITENNFEIDKRFINRSSEIHTQFTEELNTELTSFKSTLLEVAQTQSTDITNKLFAEQFNTLSEILDEHKGTLNTVVSEKLTDVQKLITDFNSDTDKNHSLQLEELKHAFTSLVNDHKDDLNQIVSKKIIDTKEEISKFTDKFEAQVPVLEERLTGIEALINEHRETLNNAAKQKIDEVSDIVKTFADEVQGRIPGLDSKIVEITEHIDTLIKEKKDIQAIVDNNKQYTTTVVNKGVQEAKDYARRILELGGGGGSVAVQYANGGTMNGDLNVTGQYLSGGVSLFNVLSGSGSGNQPYTLVDVTNSIQPVRGSNIASGDYSNIAGGFCNSASGGYSSVVGGQCNNACGTSSTVAGGEVNTASGGCSFIGGGRCNTACGYVSNVAGGLANTASGYYSSVAGGKFNCATGANSFVGSGDTNCTTNTNDVVVGGDHNCATGGASFVGGGRLSTASAQYATVAGGNQNCSTGYGASVVGGQSNNASGAYSFIGGGASNNTNSLENTFILGSNITASLSDYTFVNNISSQGLVAANGGNSTNWNSGFNAGTVYSQNSASYATTDFVNTNFFNLTGGTISGATRINNNLTVFGNLTATGTTTFNNTIFSVTSALSVVHVGSGPALYVGNNGLGDIASFVDLDQNIEIFHIGGNNGTFPNVGVKTSTPNVDFTVSGQISASNTIWSSGGNSNNWNNTYTTYNANSGTYVSQSLALAYSIAL